MLTIVLIVAAVLLAIVGSALILSAFQWNSAQVLSEEDESKRIQRRVWGIVLFGIAVVMGVAAAVWVYMDMYRNSWHTDRLEAVRDRHNGLTNGRILRNHVLRFTRWASTNTREYLKENGAVFISNLERISQMSDNEYSEAIGIDPIYLGDTIAVLIDSISGESTTPPMDIIGSGPQGVKALEILRGESEARDYEAFMKEHLPTSTN